ncbi:hypothetical protein [Bosea sp. TAF32]|uniref:hypothetical protein n=1 Tax=Bosea sp. TAF32 TaxID=3237482 RepID=UPI003F93C0C7
MEGQRDDAAGAVERDEISGNAPSAFRDDGGVDGRPSDDGRAACTGPEAEIARAAQYSALRFDVLRNAFYHSARLRHFEWQHRGLMFLIVLFGTAGVADATTGVIGQKALAAITALLATVDLVLDLRGKAQRHDSLKQRYFMLLAKLDELPGAELRQIAKWRGKVNRITAEEPVTYRIVDALAHNEALETMGLNEDEKIHVTRLQYVRRHWTAAHGVSMPYVTQWVPIHLRVGRVLKRGWNVIFNRQSN